MRIRLSLTKEQRERLAVLRRLINDDDVFEQLLADCDAAEQKAAEMGLAYKAAAPPSPLDAALDRLRQALEQARQTQGDAQLVTLVDGFAKSLKPQPQGSGPKRLGDDEKPEAERTKELGMGGFFDALGIVEKAASAPDDFLDFVMPGRRR